MKILIFLLFLITVASCGSKNTSNCDQISDGGGTLGSTTYDCPSGDPSASDLVISNINGLMDIEAGTPFSAGITITNTGSAKIFDFSITPTTNITISNNTCPTKLYQGDSCSLTIGISENIAGLKNGKITFNDRTAKLNKILDLNYQIQASYPQSISQVVTDIDYKTKKVVVGQLVDRFGNIITDSFNISASRNVSSTGLSPFSVQQISQNPQNGFLTFYVQTDLLESSLAYDTADIGILATRLYQNGTTASKNFSLTFINNKPTLSSTVQEYSVSENSYTNELVGLKEGDDKRGKALSYRLVTKPTNGVLHNCLNGLSFISLYNCSYTPNKNYTGTDTFSYIVNNGDADSVNVATVNIIVGHINVAPILSGAKNYELNQDESFSLNLVQAFDADGDSLSYSLTQLPNHGSITCTGYTCLYVPQSGYIGTDFFKYKAKDPSNAESSEYLINLNIKAINHAPTLGGTISFSTSENLAVTIQLPAASDQDVGDSLVYKIKASPTKGILSNCLNNTSNLSCTYTPNLYENTAEIFSYVAIDSKGLESVPKVVTINISQENSAPYFSNLYQEEQVLPNGSINFAINNAIDPEGNTINYILVNALPVNGGLLSSCLLNNNLNCSYTAPTGITNGAYTFQYKAQDSLGMDSSLRTVKMVIGNSNSTPSLSGSLNVVTNEDENVAFTLLQGSDVETPQQFLKYKIGSVKPSKGKLVQCADLTDSSGLTDITCEYQPNENQNGTDSFSYYVVDGRNNQSNELLVSITINSINDTPTFEKSEESITVSENQSLDFTISAASDAESDFINYAVKPGYNVANGTLSSGCISLIGQQNNCKYTPTANFNGQDSFTIQAIDIHGAITEKVFKITVSPVNNQPIFSNYSITKTVQEDGDNQISLPEATDIDTDTDLITYQIVSQPTKGLLSGCLMIQNMKGLNCLYLPYSNEQGIDSFSYKANDGQLDSPIVTVNLNIIATNDLPFFEKTTIGPIKVARGDSITFELTAAKDVEGNNLNYEIISNPGNGSISNCFIGSPMTCTYTANIDFIGNDSFVFKAKDTGSSTNTVQVDFVVGDKKNDRIFKVKNKANIEYAQKQSISVDKNVYSLGDSLVFNMATPTNLYFSNSTYIRYSDGEMKQLLSAPIVNYKAVKTTDSKLYSFEESSSGNYLRIIDKEGLVSSIGYSTNVNIFYPKEYNSNIYTGSNRSAVYKVNLIKIGQKDYSWIEPLISKDKLGISSDSKLVEVLGSLNNELYFTFFDDNNLRKLAKIKSDDSFEILTIGFSLIQDVIFYDSNGISKVYFTAGSSTSKKIYVYNPLELSSNNKLKTVTAADYIPNDVTSPHIFDAPSGGIIVYSDSVNSKMAGLDPSLDSLIEYDMQDISNITISKDQSKLMTITSTGVTTIYTDNPLLNKYNIIDGFLGQQSYSFNDSSFIVKKQNVDELYLIESTTPTLIGYQDSYVYLDNMVSDGSRSFAYKTKTTLNGSVFELFEYKQSMSFDLKKGKVNQINGLVTDSLATSYTISQSGNPQFGSINNCMGLNSTNLITNCEYTPNEGFTGSDSFKYTMIKNGVSKEFLAKITVTNTKPVIDAQSQIADVIKINNLNGTVIDYTYFNDELFFAMNRSTIGYLYRYNKAEGLKLISKSTKGFDKLRAYNNFLYYVEKTDSNKIKFFDISSRIDGTVFDDEAQSPTLTITDLIINNEKIFAIAKNYGSTLISRMLKISISNYHAELSAMPANYENGKFIRLNSDIGIEIDTRFSKYNETLDSFTNTVTMSETISVGNTSLNNENQPVFELTKTTGLLTNTYFKTYDVDDQILTSNLVFNFSGASFESFLFKRFGAGSSLTGLFEIKDTSDSYSAVLLYRQGLAVSDLFAQDAVNFLPIFNEEDGEYSSSIKTFDDKVYAIKHDDEWSYATFSRIGYDSFFYVLNHSVTPITLYKAKDADSDSISYSIVTNPSYGAISNCMGLDGSLASDLDCDYTHTDQSGSVIDSFSYRAFDGYSYSEPKIINIKIRNNTPYFANSNDITINIPVNYTTNVNLDQGYDDDGNTIYYIITTQPSKGVLSGCANNVNQLALSSTTCVYTPNSNVSGSDVFKYRLYDGLSFSVEKTVNINISPNPSPIFFTDSQQVYVPKVNSFIITLEKALDPQGNTLTYTITKNPTNGTLSNCFVVSLGKLQCTYTPTNPSIKSIDSFSYTASNGTYTSTVRTVTIINTGSLMTGELGQLHVSDSGVSLIKSGFNNINALSSLSGYSWNNTTKTLTLPANAEYNFESITVDDNVKVLFKPFSSGTSSTTPGWTRIYSQSTCIINGSLKLTGVQSSGTSDVPVIATTVDNESLSFILKTYSNGVYGGLSGGNSNVLKTSGQYGSPSYFQGGAGQLASGDIGTDSVGGTKGLDGNGVYFKCIDSLSGYGVIDVSGANGTNGQDGQVGGQDDVNRISYGGQGGSGGGNGGQGGSIKIRAAVNSFNGNLIYTKGKGGIGGYGGSANTTYTSPYSATKGTSGQNGYDGVAGSCSNADLTGDYSACN